MDGINRLDLITQRVLALNTEKLEEQLQRVLEELDAAQKRIADLEAPPAETKAVK